MTEKGIIEQFMAQKHLAVAGVSRNEKKFGSIVFHHLKKGGYAVYPVNPGMDQYHGERCYHDIKDLPAEVTALITVTNPEVTVGLVRDAAEKGIRMVWLQQGSESAENIALAEAEGLMLVKNKCIMMFAEPVTSIHSFHRFLMKLFGKYPKG